MASSIDSATTGTTSATAQGTTDNDPINAPSATSTDATAISQTSADALDNETSSAGGSNSSASNDLPTSSGPGSTTANTGGASNPAAGGTASDAMNGSGGNQTDMATNVGGASGSAGSPPDAVDTAAGGSSGVKPSMQAEDCGTASTDASPTGATPVERHGQLHVDGASLCDANNRAVTLRGQGFGWDNWWPQFYNADVVRWLRSDWCVDIVRPAMGIEPDGAYLANPGASRARVQAVVEAAIAEGLYVIIDWHAHDMHQNEAVSFFREMAQTYGDSPNVIYEIFNEPEGETWPEVKAYAETVISAIREHDPDNLVIVGNPEWDQRIDLVAEDPITSDANIIYAVHFYAATHGQWLRDRTAEALRAGIPVIVSESSGSEAAGTGANDYAEWEAWIEFMDTNQISWIHYAIADKQGETISVLRPGASANGGWDASQLTETGTYIRDVLRGYCR